MNLSKQILVMVLSCSLVLLTAQADSFGPRGQSSDQAPAAPVKQSPQELQQLVAPIALYPDALVAQILAASTYPTQIVEADRWMRSHSNLKGEELAKEVDKEDWDPSVKAMAQFPSVLENMDKNLSWASSLGEAYVEQPQDVTDAVQTLRGQARKAGHLESNEQEHVTTQGNTFIIEPADPQVVYVPAYDPWLVYGAPIIAYPGWYPVPGIFWDGVGLSFGIGFGIGFFGGFGWGWGHWGYDWHGRRAFLTIAPGSHIAETLVTRASITVISAMATAISATVTSVTAADSTVLPVFTANQGRAPARSVALIMAGMPEAFPPAGGRALEAASTEVGMAAVVAISFLCPNVGKGTSVTTE